MSKRKTHYVSPHDVGWQVKAQGAKRATAVFDTKAEAVKAGVDIASSQPLGQLRIQRQDGTIQDERTYGDDPFPPKG
jgi:hypothetical protein